MRISDWSSDVCSSDLDFLDVLRDRSEISHVARHGGRGHADRAAGAQHAEQAWKEVIVRAEVLPGVDAHDAVEEAILEGERPGVRLHGMDLAGQAEVTEHRLYHGRADPQVSGPDLHAALLGEEPGRWEERRGG